MGIFSLYWRLVDWPLSFVEGLIDKEFADIWHFVARVFLSLILLYILVDIVGRIKRIIRKARGRDSLLAGAEADLLVTKNPEMVEAIAASKTMQDTAAHLKKGKKWAQLGDLYSEAGRPKDAAKYYKKAGNKRKAALELAKAGKTLVAAKLLMKEGDFETAARYFSEHGKHGDAALAFQKAGKTVLAAAAYARAGNVQESLTMFGDYFARTGDSMEIQIQAAEECRNMLEDPVIRGKISAEQRKGLLPLLAQRFERGKQYGLAADMFREGGDLVHAGETYVLAGKLQEAAQCMRDAGKQKDAARILGRYHESKQNWKEAGAAYASSGDLLHAGECFSKGGDAARAADCYQRGNDFYRAGLAYAHAGRFEHAIGILQKVAEGHEHFDESRALLGRCFYELHDYAHCVACLENHLTGKRVDSKNVDYFYMLALASEQVGKLQTSLEVLRKVHTVDVRYRDVNQRISNISSRISLGAGAATVTTGGAGAGQGMESVENALEGRYQLEKELGRGGMGVVYLARDSQLQRPVALKFLGSLVDDSDEYRERFVREARTAARINHPNIVSIYDISASSGKAYIAMEFVEGVNLHKYIGKKGKLTPREAVNLIGQACSALGAIHEAGIIHRDIKPENILLSKGGLVKIMDFGLAKAEDSRLTRTGVVMGTPSYMAPEQALGREADARSDVYSLGLVLYECLSGKTVFRDGNIVERQLKEMPPPPSSEVEGVPAGLDDVVLKAVQKEPEKRHQSMEDLLGELRALDL